MKALITGASSGMGRDFARALHRMGYELILVARREDRMVELAKDLSCDARIIPLDLSVRENCFKLYELTKDEDIDLLINNAGFGIFGAFDEIDLEREGYVASEETELRRHERHAARVREIDHVCPRRSVQRSRRSKCGRSLHSCVNVHVRFIS